MPDVNALPTGSRRRIAARRTGNSRQTGGANFSIEEVVWHGDRMTAARRIHSPADHPSPQGLAG